MLRLVLPALLACALLPATGAAETVNCTPVTSLPATISSQGIYCLTSDLATGITSGAAIELANNNITLDCNGYKLGGLAAGPATSATGISATGRSNITIRNCNIRGFQAGILLNTGLGPDLVTGHLVEDNRLDGNTARGIMVFASASTVRRNLVTDTGGGLAIIHPIGIWTIYGADLIDNTVDGVSDSLDGSGQTVGIRVDATTPTAIIGNRVRNVRSDAQSVGFLDYGPIDVMFRGNIVASPGGTGTAIGYSCAGQSLAIDNVSIGYATATEDCIDGGGNRELP